MSKNRRSVFIGYRKRDCGRNCIQTLKITHQQRLPKQTHGWVVARLVERRQTPRVGVNKRTANAAHSTEPFSYKGVNKSTSVAAMGDQAQS